MKKLTLFLLSMTVFIFAACASSEGSDPTAEPEDTEAKPALATAVPADAPESYPAEAESAPVSVPIEPYPDDTERLDSSTGESADESYPAEGTTSEVVHDAAYPAEVDLAYVDPSTGDGQPQEAPKPGVPNDSTAITHQANQDLAKRLGVDVSEVTVVQAESRDWSDSSLGCPAPGYAYAQVITPGFQITLEVDGKQYDYHTDLNGNFLLCGEDGKPVE